MCLIGSTQKISAYTIEIAHNAALRSIIAMGVFEQLPADDTPASVQDLATRLEVNSSLLGKAKHHSQHIIC